MKTFPTLYQKSNAGALQQWSIEVEEKLFTGVIVTTWGQVGGKLQETRDAVNTGKNLGKANATTPYEQACLEAAAAWTKQLKKGYVQTVAEAEAGAVDAVIEGGIAPMLAPSKIYPHFAAKLSWPVYDQPKLDGSRCLAVVKGGVCTLWSRTRKRIKSMPHVAAAVARLFPEGAHILDGELYNHELRNDFEELMSLIRQDEPQPAGEVVEYHVYDYPSVQETFGPRHAQLVARLSGCAKPLVLVQTRTAADDAELKSHNEEDLAAGYEGTMVRNDGPYEQDKRSYHLQKLKSFVDGEYVITGADEGRGKDAGTVGAFICMTPDGKEFRCRLKATYARRRELFQRPILWQSQYLTVMYQNLTADGIPRFPIGKAIRPKNE